MVCDIWAKPLRPPEKWFKNDDISLVTDVDKVVRVKNKEGRGRPKHILYRDRIKLLGPILLRIGVSRAELFQIDAEAEDIKRCRKHWKERIPPPSFGIAENPARAVQRYLDPPTPNLRFALSHGAGYVFEHLEENPIYGVEEMQGVIVHFNGPGYFSCLIESDEPYPSISTHRLFFYSRGYGLLPLFPVDLPYDEYVVSEGVATKVTRFVVGKLEPHAVAPMPSEFSEMARKIVDKPGMVAPSDLSFYRASKRFLKRFKARFPVAVPKSLLFAHPVSILETYVRARNLIRGASEAAMALGSSTSNDLALLQSFMVQLQEAPWNSTLYYKWLGLEVASVLNPFQIGTRMVVGNGPFPCYSPLLDGSDPVTGGVSSFRHTSLKKKKNLMFNKEKKKIGGTINDIRQLTMRELQLICKALGLTSTEISSVDRWDMTFLITKVASSYVGPKVLGGRLLKYYRPEETAAHHTVTKAKDEDLQVQRLIEKQEFYIRFRQDVNASHYNLCERLAGSTKRRKIEPLDSDRCETIDDFDRYRRKRDLEKVADVWRMERMRDVKSYLAPLLYTMDGTAIVGEWRESFEDEEEVVEETVEESVEEFTE